MNNNQSIRRLPNQRWQIAATNLDACLTLANLIKISPIISQLLINRGMKTPEDAKIFLDPESLNLPSPLEEFPDLAASVELLEIAIANRG